MDQLDLFPWRIEPEHINQVLVLHRRNQEEVQRSAVTVASDEDLSITVVDAVIDALRGAGQLGVGDSFTVAVL